MTDGDSEFVAVGTLESYVEPRDAYDDVDDIAEMLSRFEDVRVESDGYDENGHRIWEVSVPR